MNFGSNTRLEEEKIDASNSHPVKHDVSVMRAFLESDVKFEWPTHLGRCSGNHCDISPDVGIPLKWKRIISDKPNASIDVYEAGSDFSFRKPFVVKTIREMDTQKARKTTAKEVENMKDLRHPHVTALLGTFAFQARLSILIFPAACCDLYQFMKRMSREDRIASNSDRTSSANSDTANSRTIWDSNLGSTSKHEENDPQEIRGEPWPLTTPVDQKAKLLRSYFVCLSRALGYLHGSGVRHKDIKPENILIDGSGSVLLTDFGISRRFPEHAPHATNSERKFTRKYASPEMMKDKDTFRDDPSDVFSLGCVFLEMATLLLGENLDNLSKYYATIVNDSSREEAYYCNLSKVHDWIDHLAIPRGSRPVQDHWPLGEMIKVQNFDPSSDTNIIAALVNIRQMLDETPLKRPGSEELWQRFQNISERKCKDCDPRRWEDIWKPSAMQQRDAQKGLNKRRSLHAREGKKPISREQVVSGDLGSMMLSTRHILDQSSLKSRRVSTPSTSPRSYSRHGHIRTRSEPESPMSQVNVDTREERAEAARSPQARLRIFQNEDMVPKKTGSEVAQASGHVSSAEAVHKTSTKFGHQHSDDLQTSRSLEMQTLQTAKLDLSDRQLTMQRNQQSQASHQRRATGEDTSTSELRNDTPHPQTRIIVYDVSQTKAFEKDFSFLRDQDYQKYPLSRFRRKVKIGDKADLIAKIDLRQLKWGTKMRRCIGGFSSIYVLHYAAQPLQKQTR